MSKKIEPTSSAIIRTKAPNKLAPQRVRVQFMNRDPSLTEQSHKIDCDINHIVRHYGREELERRMAMDPGLFTGDYIPPQDLMQSIEIVRSAEEQFNALPATVRAKFNNSPVNFLQYAQDPSNAKGMIDLGLLKKRVSVDPPQPNEPSLKPKGKSPPAGGPKEGSDT